jgi:hypothetical protein
MFEKEIEAVNKRCCENCHYYQEFKHCSIREDVIKENCPDWLLKIKD